MNKVLPWIRIVSLMMIVLVLAACRIEATLAPPIPEISQPITALFQGGTISGFSGCNTYSGSYQSDGANLTISGLTTTQAACDEAATARENSYLANLGSVNGYVVRGNGNQLTLSGAQPMTFRKQ